MKIALLNSHSSVVGGIETYLARLFPALLAEGHELLALHQALPESGRAWVAESGRIRRLIAAELSLERWTDEIRRWGPDVIFAHGCDDVGLEEATTALAPLVYFPHGYFGTCISGTKTHRRPSVRPCTRVFGTPCLAVYLPLGCGGKSPVTMWRQFLVERRRQRIVRSAQMVTVASNHMADEFRRHGCGNRVRVVHLPVFDPAIPSPTPRAQGAQQVRLLFLGRMDVPKGGHLLLDSLPAIASGLGKQVHVTFAGDGPRRQDWEAQANRVRERDSRISVEFCGWVGAERRNQLFASTDLLVVPSIWPEPFGQVGLEAGHYGVPCAAFALGGIPDWLESGTTGHLAPGNPPTAAGLAAAVIGCLSDPAHYARLREGAAAAPRKFSMERHLAELAEIFAEAAGSPVKAASSSAG